jgi:GNAT superfamily N-acetyltransferase
VLIAELQVALNGELYPEQSKHGYSVQKLLRQRVPFFVTRLDAVPAGCGGVQLFGREYAEVKRMFVRPQFRGRGLGRLMLDHLAAFARRHGVGLLRLETGIYQAEAIALYESWGFERIPPFGDYREDPLSVFFEKRID